MIISANTSWTSWQIRAIYKLIVQIKISSHSRSLYFFVVVYWPHPTKLQPNAGKFLKVFKLFSRKTDRDLTGLRARHEDENKISILMLSNTHARAHLSYVRHCPEWVIKAALLERCRWVMKCSCWQRFRRVCQRNDEAVRREDREEKKEVERQRPCDKDGTAEGVRRGRTGC